MIAWPLSRPSCLNLRPCPRPFYTLHFTKTKSLHLSFTISLHFSFDIFPCFGSSPHSLYTPVLHLVIGFDGIFFHLCYFLCLGLSCLFCYLLGFHLGLDFGGNPRPLSISPYLGLTPHSLYFFFHLIFGPCH